MERIWKRELTPEAANAWMAQTPNLVTELGIEAVKFGPNFLVGRMPVTPKHHQPYGILHGGASVVFAESLGSFAANLCLPDDHYAVGLDINANHIRSKTEGYLLGTATAVHLGRSTQVWQIDIRDEAGHMVCTSRLTMAVVAKKPHRPLP